MSGHAEYGKDKSATPSNLNLCHQSGDVNRNGGEGSIDGNHQEVGDLGEGPSAVQTIGCHVKIQLDEIFCEAAKKVCEKTSSELIQELEDDPAEWTSDSESDSDSQISANDFPDEDNSERETSKLNQYFQLISKLTNIYHKSQELVFNSSMIFSNIYPDNITLYQCPPTTKLNLNHLQRLIICPPSTLDYLASNNMKAYFRLTVGHSADAVKYEEQLRERVMFFLNSLKAPNLKEFLMRCVDDGKDICRYSDRYCIWEAALIRFLRHHSSHLLRISVETCRAPGTLLSHKPIAVTVGTEKVFQNLEELSLIFWEREPCETTLNAEDLKLTSYWSDLVKSRIYYGVLKKVVWMSQEVLSWSEVFAPLIKSNKETLEAIHVIQMGDGICSSEYLSNSIILDFTVFADVKNLKSLFLRMNRCYGLHVDKLPEHLEELCLDSIWLWTSDISMTVQKLVQLRKLKLVNNAPSKAEEAFLPQYPGQRLGLSEDTLRSAILLRKLESISVWGSSIEKQQQQPVKRPTTSAASSMSSIKNFVKRLMGIRTQKKVQPTMSEEVHMDADQPIPSFMESLGEIAVMNDEQITID